MNKRIVDFLTSVVLAVILAVGVSVWENAGIAVSSPLAEYIGKVIGAPMHLVIRGMSIIIPAAGYLAFEPMALVVLGVVWAAICFAFLSLCRRSLRGRNLLIAQTVPLMFALIAIAPVIRISHAPEDAVEACLSGRYAETHQMAHEGARLCMNARLRNMLDPASGADPIEFCASLSAEKIAAVHENEKPFIASNMSYRDYCFLSLGLARIREESAPGDTEDQKSEKKAAIVREVCAELGQRSGSAQKVEDCEAYFETSMFY